tara:strand:+ start:2724 stop:3287 length:564 start_codon:yes stop_codon:yes gene_type:complete
MKDQWIIKTDLDVKKIDKIVGEYIKSLNPDKHKFISTAGKQSTQYNIFNFIRNNKDFQYIYDVVLSSVRQVLKGKDINLLNAWTVLGQEGGYHVVHSHDPNRPFGEDQKIATVLYLNTTPKSKWQSINEDEAGHFYALYYREGKIKYWTYEPKKGDLLIFPSNMFHGAYPQPKGLRQTLNMDFQFYG